jgi:hypothetical protein
MGLFSSQPTIPNDLAVVLKNAKAVLGSNNILEANDAVAVMKGVPNLTSAGWAKILDTYVGAGEIASGLSGTDAVKDKAAIAGADTIIAASGVNASLIPARVKMSLVCNGYIFASNGVSTQTTEELRLAVSQAMPTS